MQKLIVAVSVIFALLFLIDFKSVSAIEYGGIGGRPAYPRKDAPRTESIFVHETSPGETIKEGIKVINNSKEPKTLLLYATDDTASTDGGYACEQSSEEKNGVGKWVTLAKSEVTLPPVSSVIVPFNIAVPSILDVGEHNGCIVIQEKKPTTNQAGLSLSLRTALRVLITIPGEISRALELVDFSFVYNPQTRQFIITPTLKNSGNVSVDTKIETLVTNALTRKVVKFGGEYSVLLTNPLSLNFEFQKPFWGGVYTAKTTITYKDGDTEKTLESDSIRIVALPEKKAVLFVALAILPLVVYFFYRRLYKSKHNKKK